MGQAYENTHTHAHIQLKHMAQRHAYSQPIETYSLAPHNRNIWPSPTPTANQYKHMAQRRIIGTYGRAPRPQPTNTNIWPHNSRATVFCLSWWPILLFGVVPPVYPLLVISLTYNTLQSSQPSYLRQLFTIQPPPSFTPSPNPSTTPPPFFYLVTEFFQSPHCHAVPPLWNKLPPALRQIS